MEFQNLLNNERNKCINVLKEYNTKYDTEEQKKLEITLDYLNSLLKTITDEYKPFIIDDINNINSYLFSKSN
jgi:hypothetical protein